jgi:hypothetical protein
MTPFSLRFWRPTRLPLLALVVAAAVLAHESLAQGSLPRSVQELVDRLGQSGVRVCVVPVLQSGPDPDLKGGVFLCDRERSWDELSLLQRVAECQAKWAGVVHAQPWPASDVSDEFIFREWQGCSARVGDVLLFGDARLLRLIVEAMER